MALARSLRITSVGLHYMHYNFCRVHQSLRVTPAMEAKLTDLVWTVDEIVRLLDGEPNNTTKIRSPSTRDGPFLFCHVATRGLGFCVLANLPNLPHWMNRLSQSEIPFQARSEAM